MAIIRFDSDWAGNPTLISYLHGILGMLESYFMSYAMIVIDPAKDNRNNLLPTGNSAKWVKRYRKLNSTEMKKCGIVSTCITEQPQG